MQDTRKVFQSIVLSISASLTMGSPKALSIGLVENASGQNKSLMVNVGHGLPGLDIDVENMKDIFELPAYQYDVTQVEEKQATAKVISDELTALSKEAGDDGSFAFYYTGHGNIGKIHPYSKKFDAMPIEDVRKAIEAGRQTPLERLVLIFDACHSGSFLDPFRRVAPLNRFEREMHSHHFTEAIVTAFTQKTNRQQSYWKKLLILASTEPDQTCLASPQGSYYTNALKDSYDETLQENGTLRDWHEKTRTETFGSTPTARFVPETLGDELLQEAQKKISPTPQPPPAGP